jgi:hypothetical protein
MSFDADKLYALLPAIHRLRDAGEGEPLRAMLAVIAEQIGLVEENLEQLYDDQFIETCAEWVVPYIGDLIGYRTLHGVSPKTVSARAEVGHTIAFRRRKGTAAMLEQLARDVTGWDARVVEFFLLLGWTQYMNHIRKDLWYAPDLRRSEHLERLNTPFEKTAHTVDVRLIAKGEGKYNIPNIGIFLWRLHDYPLTNSRACKVDPLDARRWRFNPLGLDSPLFTHVEPEDAITHLAEPINVPLPIGRRVLDAHLSHYYGEKKSIFLAVDGVDVPPGDVCSCDLSDAGSTWAHLPATKIAIDPVLGRIALPPNQTPAKVTVRFSYGFSANMGGGEYDRAATFEPKLEPIATVKSTALLQAALTAATAGGVVQIEDSNRYDEALALTVPAGKRMELRAANLSRPTLQRGGDTPTSGDWVLQSGADSSLTLNGLVIHGHTLRIPGAATNQLTQLTLRHCTLVPGANSSLIVEAPTVRVVIDHSIVGGLRVAANAHVSITDSIVDATSESAVAFGGPAGPPNAPGGTLRIERSTVIGQVYTHELELASNSIFLSPVVSDKKQQGCVRFSHLPLSSQAPRRFRCQPTSAEDELRVRPQFTSLLYGDPGYGQLSLRCAREIREGADDEAEMGVFHDLFQPQRETNLRVRLKEYLRFRLEAGVFYVT